MDTRDAALILTFADNDMNVTNTANRLYMHRNTVLFRFGKVIAETGLNPRRFHDLCKLVPMCAEIVNNNI